MSKEVLSNILFPEGFTKEKFTENTNQVEEVIQQGNIYSVKVLSASVKGVFVEFENGYQEIMEVDELFADFEVGRLAPTFFIGKQIYVKVLEVTQELIKISRKAALEDNKQAIKENVKEGDIVVAKIALVTPTVLLLDMGGFQGILPLADYSWSFVDSFKTLEKDESRGIIKDHFINLKFKGYQINQEGIEQMLFSRKEMFPNPWLKLEKILSVDEEVAKLISSGKWKAERQKLKLAYKRVRTEEERVAISRKINSFDYRLPRIQGKYLGVVEHIRNGKVTGNALIEIYRDPISGDPIVGRTKFPRMELEVGQTVTYVVTEFNPKNKTIFGVIKDI